MKTLNRRHLLTALTATAAASIPIHTLAAEKLDESDPTAIALGYKADAEAVDRINSTLDQSSPLACVTKAP